MAATEMTTRTLIIFFALLAPFCGCAAKSDPVNLLVFTRTQGFRHDSIPAGVATMRELCAEAGFTMKHTEEPAEFNPTILAVTDVVVFLNTSGDVLSEHQQQAFEEWWNAKSEQRGFLAIHSAADTEYDWRFYRDLIGAQFKGHPPVQEATVIREDDDHPTVQFLSERWVRVDEWYNYRTNPRDAGMHVLLALDTSTYQGSEMPGDHPIAWCRDDGSQRMLYTGGGHTIESFAEPLFREHLLAALRWTAHREGD